MKPKDQAVINVSYALQGASVVLSALFIYDILAQGTIGAMVCFAPLVAVQAYIFIRQGKLRADLKAGEKP
jgi:hypothetical protein